MPQNYRFNSEDKAVISEVNGLIRRLIYSGRLKPAEIVSVAKVLHVLVNLPSVNEEISVTIELSDNPEDHGRFRSLRFSVSNELHLECESHIQWFPSMEWHAYPGRNTEGGDYWETEWVGHFYSSNEPLAFNLKRCVITVGDEDNPLLFQPDQESCEGKQEPSPDGDLNPSSEQ